MTGCIHVIPLTKKKFKSELLYSRISRGISVSIRLLEFSGVADSRHWVSDTEHEHIRVQVAYRLTTQPANAMHKRLCTGKKNELLGNEL